ncbi:MAG: hypothetical protein WKH64_17080 [Chloroflexia bacterium]
MNSRVWLAAPIAIVAVLLAAVMAVLLIATRVGPTPGNGARTAPNAPVAAAPQAGASVKAVDAKVANGVANRPAAAVARPAVVVSSKPAASAPSKSASKPAAVVKTQPAAVVVAKPATKPAMSASSLNNLGWRAGTQWTIGVSQYARYLPQPTWIATKYRFKVVSVDAAGRNYVVSMRFADPTIQPADSLGDVMRAGYTVSTGALQLAWVQPLGKGPKLDLAKAEIILGNNFLSLDLPKAPFVGGARVKTDAPHLGAVQANRVAIKPGETATFAQGAPWWLSYSMGKDVKARLLKYTP